MARRPKIDLPKSPDTAEGAKDALHDEVRHLLGGFDELARRMGVAPYVVAGRWLAPAYHSAAVLMLRDAGHHHIGIADLVRVHAALADEQEDEAADRAETRRAAAADLRGETAEREWIAKNGAAAAWWELRPENRLDTETGPRCEVAA